MTHFAPIFGRLAPVLPTSPAGRTGMIRNGPSGLGLFHHPGLQRRDVWLAIERLRFQAPSRFAKTGNLAGSVADILAQPPLNLIDLAPPAPVSPVFQGEIKRPTIRPGTVPLGRLTLRGIGPYPRLLSLFQELLTHTMPGTRAFVESGYEGIEKSVGEPLSMEQFAQLMIERLNTLLVSLRLEVEAAAKFPPTSPFFTAFNVIYFPDGFLDRHPYAYRAAILLHRIFTEAKKIGADLGHLAAQGDMVAGLQARTQRNLEFLKQVVQGAPLPYLVDHYFPEGTLEREWFDEGWSHPRGLGHYPEEWQELEQVAVERFRNVAAVLDATKHLRTGEPDRFGIRRLLETQAGKIHLILDLIDDLETRDKKSLLDAHLRRIAERRSRLTALGFPNRGPTTRK